MASVCRFCGSSVANSHHRVALFGKKANQQRLASRISALLDVSVNDDDGLPNLICANARGPVTLYILPCILGSHKMKAFQGYDTEEPNLEGNIRGKY